MKVYEAPPGMVFVPENHYEEVESLRAQVEALTAEKEKAERDLSQAGKWLADSGAANQAVSAKLREAERERDFLVDEYERAVGIKGQGVSHAMAHLYNAITNAKCDANAKRFIELQEQLAVARRELSEARAEIIGAGIRIGELEATVEALQDDMAQM